MTDLPRYDLMHIALAKHPEGLWCKFEDVSARLQQLEAEKETLHARLAVAEHHKVLSLLGKSSWQEVVEDKLRIELAETQVALAETRDALHQIVEGFKSEAINGVICTPPALDIGNDDSVGDWNASPSRTWCARCKARWQKLFDLAAKLAPVKDQAP